MSEHLKKIQTVTASGHMTSYGAAEPRAWIDATCGHCGGQQFLVIAQQTDANWQTHPDFTKWVKCISCRRGSVIDQGEVFPSAMPLRVPKGLPPIDGVIWEEVRRCLGAGAYAAAVMVCRKLLFHVAVAHGLEPKNDKDRAPTFFEAVEHLEGEGLITKKMRPWVDRIKDIGNEASHELEPISREVALDVATFTEQLLVLAYEMDALMQPAVQEEHQTDPD